MSLCRCRKSSGPRPSRWHGREQPPQLQLTQPLNRCDQSLTVRRWANFRTLTDALLREESGSSGSSPPAALFSCVAAQGGRVRTAGSSQTRLCATFGSHLDSPGHTNETFYTKRSRQALVRPLVRDTFVDHSESSLKKDITFRNVVF